MKEIPLLDRLQTLLGTEAIQIVAVNYKESRDQYRKIAKAFDESSTLLTHDRNGAIGRKYGVGGIPHLVVGQEGKIVYQAVGYGEKSLNKIIRVIKRHLQEWLFNKSRASVCVPTNSHTL